MRKLGSVLTRAARRNRPAPPSACEQRMPSSAIPNPMDQSVAAFGGVAKRFANSMLALDGFDLSIRGGEFLALLGAAGMRQVDCAAADRGASPSPPAAAFCGKVGGAAAGDFELDRRV
jgi:hypothetical protein